MLALSIAGSPIIHKHSSYINTAIGENVEMVCLYDSNPEPRKIQWIRNDEIVQSVPAQTIITNDHHNHHNRTRLTIKNVQQKDLQAYYCKIEVRVAKLRIPVQGGLMCFNVI